MTPEEKAKAYDKAIEYAHYLINKQCKEGTDGSFHRADLQKMFPALEKNEDEKIRKAISQCVEDMRGQFEKLYSVHHKDAIAWLEKQGEHANFINKIQIGDKVTRNEGGVLVNISQLNRVAKKRKKYEWDAEKKEMKKVERKPDELPKGEDYGIDGLYNAIRILEKTLGKVEGYQTDDGILEHECAISAVKELFKQQLAWSALDERNLQEIIDEIKAIKNKAPRYDIEIYDRYLSWLQSLRPRNKYAYNPYKAVVESIAEMCKHYDKASHSGLRDFYDNVKVKCKDAKEYDSLFPQNAWVPSDEQMEALDDFIYAKYPNTEKYGAAVKSLYQDLKQLKEK